jgi:hypothetical protein
MSLYGDVMVMQVADELPSYSSDKACGVLNLIDNAGIHGADFDSLVRGTGVAEELVREVLQDLYEATLVRRSADGRYCMTPLGGQVLLLAGL